jgi:Ion channel
MGTTRAMGNSFGHSGSSGTKSKATPMLLFQSIVSIAALLINHGLGSGVVVRLVCLALITGLGIALAILILRLWKVENQPDRPIFPWMLCFLALALVYQALDGADFYIRELYGGYLMQSTMIEGLNFSVQTLTTVGYGNWPLTALAPNDIRLLVLREYSVGLMIFGASLFTIVFGMTTTWLLQM